MVANTVWYLENFRRGIAERITDEGWDVVFVAPGGGGKDSVGLTGIRSIHVPLKRRVWAPVHHAVAVWQLAALFRREKPTIVHLNTMQAIVLGNAAAMFCRQPGVISAVAGLGHFLGDRTGKGIAGRVISYMVEWLVALRTDVIIVQHESDRQICEKWGMRRKQQVVVVPGSGVDTSRFQPSDTEEDPGRQIPRILFAGRWLGSKGVVRYLECAGLLNGRSVRAEWTLAGAPDSGNPDSLTKAEVERLAEASGVRVVGHVDNMVELFRKTDIFVLPTSYGEGVPRSLVEAAAVGLPVVCTDHPGCRMVVENDVSGIITKSDSTRDLAEAIETLISDPGRRKDMGRNARRIVLEGEFDEIAVATKTLGVYEKVLTKRGLRS